MNESIRVVVAEIAQADSFLLTQRLETAVLPFFWEFPGGRVHDDEDDEKALRRCLKDRIDADINIGECVMEHTHQYKGYSVVLIVYRASLCSAITAKRVQAIRWVPLAEFSNYQFPPADQKTMDLLLADGFSS